MLLHEQGRRKLGQILLDGGFISSEDVEKALSEQRRTNELLGQILIRMGVVDPVEIQAALSVQEHISSLEASIRSAAGTRRLLGDLLLMAGRISGDQLEQALELQKVTGERLGEVFTRLGLLKEEQLNSVLAFQQNQGSALPVANPFRLGELLVTTGFISRTQLDDALLKQAASKKKLGEVLVEGGYVKLHHVKHGISIQHKLVTAALAAILAVTELTLSGCGGGGGTAGEPQSAASVTTQYSAVQVDNSAYLTVTSNDYNLATPTFYYSTVNDSFWSIQANIANNVQDIDTRCVLRIDVPRIDGSWPQLNKAFSVEDNPDFEKFPGNILVFNGSRATLSKVEMGTITFSPDSIASEHVSGSYDVIMTDYGSSQVPVPQHHLKGTFHFKMGAFGPATI